MPARGHDGPLAQIRGSAGRHMRIKILSVKTLSPPAPVGFVTVRDRTLTPLPERFIEWARKIANSDTARASTRRRQCPRLAFFAARSLI